MCYISKVKFTKSFALLIYYVKHKSLVFVQNPLNFFGFCGVPHCGHGPQQSVEVSPWFCSSSLHVPGCVGRFVYGFVAPPS